MGYAERRLEFIGKTDDGLFAAKPEIVSLSSRLSQAVGRICQSDCDVVNLGDSRYTVDLEGMTVQGCFKNINLPQIQDRTHKWGLNS